MHTLDPSKQEAKAGGALRLVPSLVLQNEFQDSQDYTEKPCFQNKTTKQTNKR